MFVTGMAVIGYDTWVQRKRRRRLLPRKLDDQQDRRQALVDRDAVLDRALLPDQLAVIGRDDDQARVVPRLPSKRIDQTAHCAVVTFIAGSVWCSSWIRQGRATACWRR